MGVFCFFGCFPLFVLFVCGVFVGCFCGCPFLKATSLANYVHFRPPASVARKKSLFAVVTSAWLLFENQTPFGKDYMIYYTISY